MTFDEASEILDSVYLLLRSFEDGAFKDGAIRVGQLSRPLSLAFLGIEKSVKSKIRN